MATVAELGQKVKMKYPGAYDDLSDIELGQKVKLKYPGAYDDFTDEPQAQAVPDNRGILQKAGDYVQSKNLPGAQLGQAVGTSIHGFKQLFKGDMAGFNQAVAENDQRFKKVVGDVARSVAIPVTLAANPSTALKAAGQFGVLGAVQGGGGSLAEGKDIKTSAVDAFKSGLASGVTAGVLTGAGNAISSRFANTPEKVYSRVLNVSNPIKEAGKDPSRFLADKGIWGNLGTFAKATKEGIEKENAAIAQKLSKIPGGASYGELRNSAIEKMSKTLGDLYSKQELGALVDKVPINKIKESGIINWKNLDGVRKQLSGLLSDGQWLRSSPSENVKATKAMYGAITELLQKTSGTQAEFATLTKWRTTEKLIKKALLDADKKFKLGLTDLAFGGVGTIVGAVTGEGDLGSRVKNALVVGAGSLIGERAFNSPAVRTGAVQAVKNLVPKAGRIFRSGSSLGASSIAK